MMQSWSRKSSDLRLMSYFSEIRLRGNSLTYIGHSEDRESSGSWLRGHGSLYRQRRVPSGQQTLAKRHPGNDKGPKERGTIGLKIYLMI